MISSNVFMIVRLQLLCAVTATSTDEDSDAETTDTMESSLADLYVTLDDDLNATDDQEPCSTSYDDDSKISL